MSLLQDIIGLCRDIIGLFKKTPDKPPTKPERTSERIDEEESEETGDLTMIADKMLERLNKRRKK